MSNNLFAFNLSQEIPETEIFEYEDKTEYDADRQVWKGVGSTQLGATGTRQLCNYATGYCCQATPLQCYGWCYKGDWGKVDSTDSD